MAKGLVITIEYQLARWVAGESLHRATTHHSNLWPLDPPGSEPRRWGCRDCGVAADTIEQLQGTKCANSGGECVPDFSCCEPHLADPIEKRIAFADAFNARIAAQKSDVFTQ